MKFVSIDDANGFCLVTINQATIELKDKEFDEFVMAVLLTLAQNTGKQLMKEETQI
jgi:hypothetical protein